MKKPQLIRFFFAALTVTTFACNTSSTETKTEQGQEVAKYKCPMDCENGKIYDKPGKCAVCEMDLEKFNEL